MTLDKILKTLAENKKCDKCGESYKNGSFISVIKNDGISFECEKCGFKKEVK